MVTPSKKTVKVRPWRYTWYPTLFHLSIQSLANLTYQVFLESVTDFHQLPRSSPLPPKCRLPSPLCGKSIFILLPYFPSHNHSLQSKQSNIFQNTETLLLKRLTLRIKTNFLKTYYKRLWIVWPYPILLASFCFTPVRSFTSNHIGWSLFLSNSKLLQSFCFKWFSLLP